MVSKESYKRFRNRLYLEKYIFIEYFSFFVPSLFLPTYFVNKKLKVGKKVNVVCSIIPESTIYPSFMSE